MTDFNYIENYIIDFIDRHVSEKVFLNLKPKTILIQPVKKHGSILLSMFWIKILQHKNNYPTQNVSYNCKKIDDAEILYFFVEEVMISLNLLSGSLQIEGSFAMEWFKSRILTLIRNYIGCKDGDTLINEDQNKWNKNSSKYNEKLRSHCLSINSRSTVLEDEHLSNLMVDSVLDAACENIRNSSLKSSKVWIYRFWKSLLYRWCSDANVKIVIATSQIDPSRFQDIADISLLLRATSQILGIYLPFICDKIGMYTSLENVKKASLSPYKASEQTWIESEIFNKIIMPKNGIGCNFIAGIYPNNMVYMMLTSCRFNGQDFDTDCQHSVQYIEMLEMHFERDYICNLQS